MDRYQQIISELGTLNKTSRIQLNKIEIQIDKLKCMMNQVREDTEHTQKQLQQEQQKLMIELIPKCCIDQVSDSPGEMVKLLYVDFDLNNEPPYVHPR